MTTSTRTTPTREAAPGAARGAPRPGQDPALRAARHAAFARTGPGRLALRNLVRGRPQYALMLLSDYGRAIMTSKYDAFTTDLAYVKRPSGRLGPVGALIDRLVLGSDLHRDLRDRLRLVTAELAQAIEERHVSRVRRQPARPPRPAGSTADASPDTPPVRVLTVPSGLCRDLIGAATALREATPEVLPGLELWALDLDERGDVIPEAARRCRAAGLDVRFCRADVLDFAAVRRAAGDRRFDVINCIGLASWLSLAEVERLVSFFAAELLAPGGTLIIDNFARHSTSYAGPHLEIFIEYHDPAAFEAGITGSGLTLVRRQLTERRVATVYTLRTE